MDKETGRLKYSGWVKRDQNIEFNYEAVPWDKTKSFITEYTKIRHLTLILTFSKNTIIISRLYDIGVNCIFISTTIIKAQEDNEDVFARISDDMTVKELHAIVHSDTKSLSLQPFSVKGSYENMNLTEKKDFDHSKYQRVLNFKETNVHPFNTLFDFDIFMDKNDEALSIF